MRIASLILGGIAGFMGLAWTTFLWLVGSWLSTGTPLVPGVFALIGLIGASYARHRLRVCVVLESIAGVGLLAGEHFLLGSLFLGATALALVALGRSQPEERLEGASRADATSAVTVAGVTGVAVVAGFLLPVVVVLIVLSALSGH